MKYSLQFVAFSFLFLASCTKEDSGNTEETPSVYKVTYSFLLEEGNMDALTIVFLDENSLEEQINPTGNQWQYEINNAQSNTSYYFEASFNALPSQEFKVLAEMTIFEDNAIISIDRCSHSIVQLPQTVPLNCRLSGKIN
jgi:hypothetical protein